MNKLADLFTDRQLVALTTFSDLVGEARERIRLDAVAAGLPDDGVPLREGGTGATAYAEAVGVYLAFAVDRIATDRVNDSFVGTTRLEKVRNTALVRQAIADDMGLRGGELSAIPSTGSADGCSRLGMIQSVDGTTPAEKEEWRFQADAVTQGHFGETRSPPRIRLITIMWLR